MHGMYSELDKLFTCDNCGAEIRTEGDVYSCGMCGYEFDGPVNISISEGTGESAFKKKTRAVKKKNKHVCRSTCHKYETTYAKMGKGAAYCNVCDKYVKVEEPYAPCPCCGASKSMRRKTWRNKDRGFGRH